MTSSDSAGQERAFAVKSSTFGGLIEDIVSEYNTPIAIRPKKMADWNPTIESEGGEIQEEVLAGRGRPSAQADARQERRRPAAGSPGSGRKPGEEFLVKIEGRGNGRWNQRTSRTRGAGC